MPRGGLVREKEEIDPIIICFKILKLIGCWVIDSKSTLLRFLYQIHHYFVLTGFTILPVLEVIDIINVRHDFEKLNYNLTASSGTVMLTFKMAIVLYNRVKLTKLQKDFATFLYLPFLGKSKEDKTILGEHDDASRKMLKFFFLYLGIPAVTTWCIIPAIDSTEEEKLTPMRAWWPFDHQKSPVYEIIWGYQSYMLYMYCGGIITIDFIFFCFVPKFCVHYDILQNNMKLLGSRYENKAELHESLEDEAITYKSLKQITMHQTALIRRCREFDEIYRQIVFIHFFGMAILMCCTILDVVMVPKTSMNLRLLTQIQYFTAIVMDTFMYCYHGNRLIDRANAFAQGIYSMPWYEMSPRCKKIIVQMISCSRIPPAMTGGGRFLINYETFLAVCKMSYNILAVLEQRKNSQT